MIIEQLIVGLEAELHNVEAFADELEDVGVDVDSLRDALEEVWDQVSNIREKHLK